MIGRDDGREDALAFCRGPGIEQVFWTSVTVRRAKVGRPVRNVLGEGAERDLVKSFEDDCGLQDMTTHVSR